MTSSVLARFVGRWGRPLALLAPAVLILGAILVFAVDVPRADEWDTPGALLEAAVGGEPWGRRLLAQHTDSRVAVPLLIFAGVSLPLGWHVIYFMVLGWGCALLTGGLVLRLMRRGPGGAWRGVVPALLASGALFSASQYENWLWGFGLLMFLPPLFLVTCLWINTTRLHFWQKVLLCAGLSCASTFTFAHGLLCWGLGFPWLELRRPGAGPDARRRARLPWVLVYVALLAATLGAFFHDYQSIAPPPAESGTSVTAMLRFFVAYFGAPYSPPYGAVGAAAVPLASLVGTGVLLALTFLIVVALRHLRRFPEALPRFFPWFCLATYALVTGGLVASMRTPFGPLHALVSRYATHSLWAMICIAGLLHELWAERRAAGPRLRVALGVIAGVCGCLTLLAEALGCAHLPDARAQATQDLLTVRLTRIAPADPLLLQLFDPTRPHELRRRAAALQHHGLLRLRFIERDIAQKLTAPDGDAGGRVTIQAVPNDGVLLHGWAAIPGTNAPPDCVLVARPDGAGGLHLVTGLTLSGTPPGPAPADGPPGRPPAFGLSHVVPQRAAFAPLSALRVFAVDLTARRVFTMEARVE